MSLGAWLNEELVVTAPTGVAPRITELLARYAGLRLGFADACVIACAERHGGRVLTFAQLDFGPAAREGAISVVPVPR